MLSIIFCEIAKNMQITRRGLLIIVVFYHRKSNAIEEKLFHI